jgi:hypothetical protein
MRVVDRYRLLGTVTSYNASKTRSVDRQLFVLYADDFKNVTDPELDPIIYVVGKGNTASVMRVHVRDVGRACHVHEGLYECFIRDGILGRFFLTSVISAIFMIVLKNTMFVMMWSPHC